MPNADWRTYLKSSSAGSALSVFIFLIGVSSDRSSSSATTDSDTLRFPLEAGVFVPPVFALVGARLRGVFGVVAGAAPSPVAEALPEPPSFLRSFWRCCLNGDVSLVRFENDELSDAKKKDARKHESNDAMLVRDSLDGAGVALCMHPIHNAPKLVLSWHNLILHATQQSLVRIMVPCHSLIGHFGYRRKAR